MNALKCSHTRPSSAKAQCAELTTQETASPGSSCICTRTWILHSRHGSIVLNEYSRSQQHLSKAAAAAPAAALPALLAEVLAAMKATQAAEQSAGSMKALNAMNAVLVSVPHMCQCKQLLATMLAAMKAMNAVLFLFQTCANVKLSW